MMNETAFPRGRRPREEKEDVASPPGMKRKHEPKAEKDDYLFGVDKSSSKKKKKRKAADAASGSSFALPLGGGFVQAGKGKDKGATIEALSFAKLSKGTKLLGIVREVQDDFCLVALPNLLTGYVLPKPESDQPPLSQQLTEGQILSVYVLKTASEAVGKGKHQVTRRRIQVSVEPHHMNPNTATPSQHDLLRGRVKSVEDHGVIVDLGNGHQGFCKFVNVEGEYQTDMDEGSSVSKLLLNEGRIHDFIMEDKSKATAGSRVVSLCLPDTATLSKRVLPSAYHPTLQDLSPGGLVNVKVEGMARNGLLVSFAIFRGAVHVNHLGANWMPSNKMGSDDAWKEVFRSVRNLPARIIAVDSRTKAIRLSLQPHVLGLAPPPSLPPIGTVIDNATVIRLDPGIGALLSLPPLENPPKLMSSHLTKNESYREASQRPAAYVHISKASSHRVLEADFAKDFAPSTQHKLRILSTTHWVEGMASAATAPDVVEAHVLNHEDLVPGKIYRNVPVCGQLDGGSILVDFGMGVRGLIPALQLFDKSNMTSDYRTKLRKEKFGLDNKVDVRVLTVDTRTKKCILTAKKSLVKATDVFDDYSTVQVGQRSTGYVSKIDGKAIYVTFANRVYGRVTAKSLAAELGVEDHRVNYAIGDVVKCRVVSCRRRVGKSLNSYVDESTEDVENPDGSRRGFWDLNISLNVQDGADDDDEAAIEKAKSKSRRIRLKSGALLPSKSMKIVEIVPSIDKKRGTGFIPGHAIVRVKSKYITIDEDTGALPYVECKIPFDQLLDSYTKEDMASKESMDEFAKKHLTVGKKIEKEALILSDPKKSSDEYASGIGKLPIVSLRPTLIATAKESSESKILIPDANTNLYMGAIVQGFVHQADPRHGAFVRFLDDITGLVPKLKNGQNLAKWETVTCKIVALDVTCQPPKILLRKASAAAKAKAKKSAKSAKSTGPAPDIKAGDKIKGAKVVAVNFSRAKLKILDEKFSSSSIRARIHVTMSESSPLAKPKRRRRANGEDGEQIEKGHPFYKWNTGKSIENLVCVSVEQRGGETFVELSTRKPNNGLPLFYEKPAELTPGMNVSCIVVAVAKSRRGLFVQPSPGVKCFIPSLELSEDADVLNELESYFPLGSRLDARVMDKDTWKKKNSWGIRIPKLKTEKESKEQKENDVPFLSRLLSKRKSKSFIIPKATKGQLVVGRVNRTARLYRAPSLMVDLRGGFKGRCCVTELDEPDEWVNMPLGRQEAGNVDTRQQRSMSIDEVNNEGEDDDDEMSTGGDEKEEESNDSSGYHHGEFVQCRVLEGISGHPVVEVSLRPSRLEGDLDNDEVPGENELVNAFVATTNKKGCFLRLSRSVEGRVILKELADGFLKDPELSFPMGRLVVGRVKAIKGGKKKGKTKITKTVDIDMRESKLMDQEQERLKFTDIKQDGKYKGIVTRIEDYGVFVRLENSDVSGLVHKSECSDSYVKSVNDLYDPGDLVKVLVIKKEEEDGKRQLGFSMKASHFEDDEDSDDESSLEDEDSDVEMQDDDDAEEESNDDDVDSDDENYMSKLAAKMQVEGDDDHSDESDDEDDASDDEDDASDDEDDGKAKTKSSMETNVGFDWGTKPSNRDEDESDEDSSDDDDSESEEEGADDDDNHKSSGHSSRKKAAARRQEEELISKREKALADGTADENPETAADFERLLASEPNNSEHWIRYMAHYLSLADMEGCRRVAQRAFDRIDFRKEGEKLNVWTALMTMELKFGGDFDATIDKACQQNNPKQVYLRACELLEKEVNSSSTSAAAVAVTRADKLYDKMCKKFRSKKTVWIAYLQYLLKNGRHQEAHALLKRALMSLPSYKHVEIMSRLAQLEFEHGSVERGRTVFDGILQKYPKRLDLLFVLVDKEVKAGQVDAARAVLKKTAETSTKLTDKQMKKLFRKWMKVEEECGTEDSQESVKDVARAYVERTSK